MKNLDLGKEKINKLLLTFAIPCVISMLINSVYNIVDQIFIGKGVGTLGNAATNVIFPLVIMFNSIAGLIGNGASANLSLKLGEGKVSDVKKTVGNAILMLIISSVFISFIAYLLLPNLVYLFGCTENVYDYALSYGRIILIGAPFMIIYSGLSSIIRADGSPSYSMKVLVIGAIINLILDPIFIFTFNMGVSGGALATVIGQFISFLLAILYIPKMKNVKLDKESLKIDKTSFRILGLGLSSFITQITVLALFVFMNNILTKYGALTKFGADIPLSVYGVVSKINSLFISSVLGISIGSQPIVGFNYGAMKYDRVRETLKKVLIANFTIGIIFNVIFYLFPTQVVGIFISNSDPNYELFMEFAVLLCRTFLIVCSLNALEMTTSIVVQSLGNVIKATAVSFIRQIILFIPISLILCICFDKGIYGVLYGGPIADLLTFIICIFIFNSEYKKFKNPQVRKNNLNVIENNKKYYNGKKLVITISRTYGSGGRYIGELLANEIGIPCYDKEVISKASLESGLAENYIEDSEQKLKNVKYQGNNDDRIFIAEEKIINKLAEEESCIIIGRCANYILKDRKDVIKIFLYTDSSSAVKRAVDYYGIDEKDALKTIKNINKQREKHYKYYTGCDFRNSDLYDLMLSTDSLGIEKTVELIKDFIMKK